MKDTTKELADSVGAVYPVLFMGRHDGVLFTETELEMFANLVAAAERAKCLKIADEFANADLYASMVAIAIRARGNT